MFNRGGHFGPGAAPQRQGRPSNIPRNVYYGFNEPSYSSFQGSAEAGNPRGFGGKRGGSRGPRREMSQALKRPHPGNDVGGGPAKKATQYNGTPFQIVKNLAKKCVRKHRKPTQYIKVPQGAVDITLPTFDAQALDLISKMQFTENQKLEVQQVLLDLTGALQSLVPDFDPIVYGSICTGLALRTSDVDCFIRSDIIPDGEERMALLLKSRSLLTRRKKFEDVVGIPKARVPILKATHRETGIEVDLNCTSDYGILNSNLIQYLVHLDDRIRQLVILIQIFYRCCNIAGTNKVTSYAISLLVLFFLQRLDHPMIPPLYKILYVGEGQMWPGRLERTAHLHVDISQNKMNLSELFAEYFKFYATFDFTRVISLYLGKDIEGWRFSPENPQLPVELGIYETYLRTSVEIDHRRGFVDKLLMVQDPIEHHRNTTWNVPFPVFKVFISLNQSYYELTMNKPETQWLVNVMAGVSSVNKPVVSKVDTKKSASTTYQNIPPLQFIFNYPMEGLETTWPPHFLPDLAAVFDLLLIEHKIVETSNRLVLRLETHFNVFTKIFKKQHLEVIVDPGKYETVKNEMNAIKSRRKKPESSFCANVIITRSTIPDELTISIQDDNKSEYNTFTHVAYELKNNLSGLLNSVRVLRLSGVTFNEPKP